MMLKFDLVIVPGEPPANSTLRKIITAKSTSELYHLIEDEPLNFTPPTDDNPYFFNMLRLSYLNEANSSEQGVLRGNLTASITLIVLIFSLLILSALTIVFPLIRYSKKNIHNKPKQKVLLPAALYFSLIGAGFMFVEIGMLQHLSLFLGHPSYALGIVLFTIILSAGIGSYLSERLRLTSSPWKYLFPALTAIAVLAMRFIVGFIIERMITEPVFTKILVSIFLIFPTGFLLGLFFPTGMKLVKAHAGLETPWFWALNGIFGVLCSAIAVFIAIYFGISINFYIASLCYGSILFLIGHLSRSADGSSVLYY